MKDHRKARPFLFMLLWVTVAMATAERAAQAGGFGSPELGVRRTGMAAVVGNPDEPSAVFHNPAGISLLKGTHLYIYGALSFIGTEFRIKPWDGSNEVLGVEPEADGYYGATKPSQAWGVLPLLAVTHELIDDKLWIGGGTYVYNFAGAKLPKDAVTRYHLTEGYVVAPVISAVAAYKLHETFTVALGAGLVYARQKGERRQFPIIDGADLTFLLGTDALVTLEGSDTSMAYNGGLLWQPNDRVSVGAAFLGRNKLQMKGDIKIQFGSDSPTPGDVLAGKHVTDFLIPWTFQTGVNVHATPQLEIGMEGRYWLYGELEEQYSDLIGIGLIEELRSPRQYRNTWQLSGGIRGHSIDALPGLELMAGFHYDISPAPSRTKALDQPTFDHVGLHTGLRYDMGRYKLGASWLRYWYKVDEINDSITSPPTNAAKTSASNNFFALSFEAELGN